MEGGLGGEFRRLIAVAAETKRGLVMHSGVIVDIEF